MQANWYLIFAVALIESFVLSLLLTALVRRLALRLNFVDQPGERKMHSAPVPLMGGVAIYVSFHVVIVVNLVLLYLAPQFGLNWIEEHVFRFLGQDSIRELTGLVAGAFLIFLLGVVDDFKILSPEVKLFGQIVAALVLVLSGVRMDLFIPQLLDASGVASYLSDGAVEGLNWTLTAGVTMFWVVMMTNSMNFLDNMDGLCGGVSIIAALSLFLCVLPGEEFFVCVLLMAFAGSVAGFLYHNLNPAKIFMGDAGAMFSGYILSTVALLGTFWSGGGVSRIAIAAPLLALCVPIFDTVSVVYIRWRNGESIMKGDKRHFSHRLVELGMTPRQAVDFIFLVAAVTDRKSTRLNSSH